MQVTVPRFEPLRTARLTIRPMRSADAEALWARRNDESTARFQSWALPYPIADAEELVASMVDLDGVPPVDGWFQIAVEDGATGDPVGDLALHLTFDGRCAEIGYTVAASARRRGIAHEATDALVRWLFEAVGVSRVSAMTHPDNIASLRVAERVGMVFEGCTRNSYWVGEDNTDDWHFGMTPEMWRAWHDRPRHRPDEVGLVEVTGANLDSVGALATHRSQRRLVSPIENWFGVIHAPDRDDGVCLRPWLRAIEADGDIVGALLMSTPDDDDRDAYVWRLLVDRMHQGRGIGRRVLDLALDRSRTWNAESVRISWCDLPGSAGPLYLDHGFVPTGRIVDGEIEARLQLSTAPSTAPAMVDRTDVSR